MHVSSYPFRPDAHYRNHTTAIGVPLIYDSAAFETYRPKNLSSRCGALFLNFVLDAQAADAGRP
jgi:hypothetical protein